LKQQRGLLISINPAGGSHKTASVFRQAMQQVDDYVQHKRSQELADQESSHTIRSQTSRDAPN
jgi:hypothetical protein